MSGGVKAALEAAMAGGGDMDEVVQSGLFDDLDPTETGALDAPSPLSKALAPSKPRRGRPPGSKNRRTEAVAAWLLSQHRHPMQVLMEAYGMTPTELCERIGVSPTSDNLLDVFKLQMRFAEAVLPYVAQRLPQAVQIDAQAGVTIAIGGVSVPARGGEAGEIGAIEGEILGVRLPEVGPDKSDDDTTN